MKSVLVHTRMTVLYAKTNQYMSVRVYSSNYKTVEGGGDCSYCTVGVFPYERDATLGDALMTSQVYSGGAHPASGATRRD